MAKSRKIPWFRVYTSSKGALQSIDDEKLGKALKAALKYFDNNGNFENTGNGIADKETLIAFNILKQGIDDSLEEYNARVEDGKKGAAARKTKYQELENQLEKLSQQYGGCETLPNPVNFRDF